jgi:hypothetical protein
MCSDEHRRCLEAFATLIVAMENKRVSEKGGDADRIRRDACEQTGQHRDDEWMFGVVKNPRYSGANPK